MLVNVDLKPTWHTYNTECGQHRGQNRLEVVRTPHHATRGTTQSHQQVLCTSDGCHTGVHNINIRTLRAGPACLLRRLLRLYIYMIGRGLLRMPVCVFVDVCVYRIWNPGSDACRYSTCTRKRCLQAQWRTAASCRDVAVHKLAFARRVREGRNNLGVEMVVNVSVVESSDQWRCAQRNSGYQGQKRHDHLPARNAWGSDWCLKHISSAGADFSH